ncbi:Carboxypeptidase regulatory-like domain-containing protein [Granulicella pectinivorans]|uniref:Carboxypeptidase regulatory-like domain-containing protein n=1 Tax=Granulicella pectinivorans TaxID=474950 RepID=A0A1I6MB64_9BACT|nr:Carboxypeptidase regulatory-like domain-containing protein [Granulicella pectinivorans]
MNPFPTNARSGWSYYPTLALLLLSLVFSASTAHAQALYGSVTGTITDASGAVIPNAAIVLTNQGTSAVQTVTTDAQGLYTVRNLLPGSYSISLARTGSFAGYLQRDIAIEINRESRIDITLQAASVTTEISVGTSAPMLQTETAEVNHEISQTQIAELPITSTQGRNYQALYTLLPGASAVGEQNSTASNPSRAMSVNMNGVSYNTNTTRIDGAVNYYGWLAYLIAYVPPADSIQSVNIVTNSFNAEQGVAGGASINISIKTGTRQFHGGAWEYNQLFNTNARPYTTNTGQVPKNIFNQFGFSVGGPVYLPRILTGKKKLFFFEAFERTTRRQLITGLQSVPTVAMLNGDFSAIAGSFPLLADPQPGGTGAYLASGSRPTFQSEYGCNCIPASRQSVAAKTMLALLQPISATITNPNYANQLNNDYTGSGTLAYNRNTNDTKVTYIPTENTSIFGRYSIEPFTVTDPQELGAAGGGTFDGGQPGAAAGRVQNVGLGMSHVITPHLLVDADAGYTRQVTGAQSSIDIAAGDYGTDKLGIPGTNGFGINYVGQPSFTPSGGSQFSGLGNTNGANPFLFRDNQFTADVNVSWTLGKHAMKAGGTWYHFDLNHFQPNVNPRGAFTFLGGMTTNTSGVNAYEALADMLLGLPNNGIGTAITKGNQLFNPNAVRWTETGVYAQDQWDVTPKLTLSYGARYEYYPVPYRDKTGIFRLDPNLPQSANVIIGGLGGNAKSTGVDVGWGQIVPRVGAVYRVNDKLVVRSGFGITTDPENLRFLRDTYPMVLIPAYIGTGTNTIAVDSNNNPLPLTVGIPALVTPSISSGFVSLPVTTTTNTIPTVIHRGYIESWNLFVQHDLGREFVMNIGYVGTQSVRQFTNYTLNAAPLPDGTTTCMANGQYNPSSVFYTHGLGSNPCNFAANQLLNQQHCTTVTAGPTCYNTAGITMNRPVGSSNYNGLQAQLTRNAGRLAQFGVVYTWSHAFAFAENGAGTGSTGPAFSYPGYWQQNRATASYDRTNNFQFWSIYHLPFGRGQMLASHGIASAILGGFQLNGQLSHVSGAPFSVSANSNVLNSNGQPEYADLIAPYKQLGGHARLAGSPVGGQAWFDPASFASPVEPTSTVNPATALPSQIVAPHFGNTHRNQFRGPGVTTINASVFRSFHVYHESDFQVRVEAFNLPNHPQLTTNPNATVNSATPGVPATTGNFGYITSFGNTRTLQFSGRISF